MKKAYVHFTETDFSISEILMLATWSVSRQVVVDKYWSGAKAPTQRHFTTTLLWSERAFYVRFDAAQHEPFVLSDCPNLNLKTIGLWERDVCEIFIAPDPTNPRRYFEFEIAPNGEWLDLEIIQTPEKRITNWNYNSNMQTGAKILAENRVVMVLKISWEAFGKKPKAGDLWLGNLFRCVGRGNKRGYLAWSPTETPKPNFHVPEKFGAFEFVS